MVPIENLWCASPRKYHAVEGEEHESTQEHGELTKLGASVVACSQCWVRIDLA